MYGETGMPAALSKPAAVQRHLWDRERGTYVPVDDLVETEAERSEIKKFGGGKKRRFLKGPVPWDWIWRASQLPGKALVIGLCIWRLSGATGKRAVPLSNSELRPFGIDRAAKSRGLAALEKAGLIAVSRSRGRWPLITLREAEPPSQ